MEKRGRRSKEGIEGQRGERQVKWKKCEREKGERGRETDWWRRAGREKKKTDGLGKQGGKPASVNSGHLNLVFLKLEQCCF